MELLEGCKSLKIERTCHSGFLWAFEFLNYPGVTPDKKKLTVLESYMRSNTNKLLNGTNFGENQFVAVVKSAIKTVVRGYILLFTPDGRGGTHDVFFIDYGKVEKINGGDLRKLPEYASVEKLPAQSWRIGIYGVLPLFIELQFGEPYIKKVGESWNGKDIAFIENVLKKYDIVEFRELKRYHEYRFGYIYLKDIENQSVTTLQKLLVDGGYAVEVEDFDKHIPSIVQRIKSTSDHALFPTGEKYDDSNFTDIPDSPLEADSSISEESVSSLPRPISSQSSEISSVEASPSSSQEPMLSQSFEISSDKSSITVMSTQTSPQLSSISDPTPAPKAGKGRGELMKRLQLQKAPPLQPSPMIGRLPLNTVDEFEDATETVYCDAGFSQNLTLSPSSSVEFLTPINGSPSTSRRQSSSLSSSIEITAVTPARVQPEIETISLITPPRNPTIIPLSSSKDEVPTIDLTTPPTVSLITPSSPQNHDSSSREWSSGSTPSVSRRGRGRGELLLSLSRSSQSSISSSTSQDYLNKRLSEFKHDERDLEDGLIDKSITKIMVLGNEGVYRFKPKYSISDFDLHPGIKTRASQLHLYDLRRCQRYMIAAMLTRKHVTMIDASKTGKTVSCLIALFSLLKNDQFYQSLPVGPGPRAIILCPYSSQCETIDRQCKELNKCVDTRFKTLRINVAYGCGKEAEKEKLQELTHGYDILITTPRCLLRLLETPEMMNFKRLCHLVLDNADTLCNSYREEIDKILDSAHSCLKKCENGLILPQRVIISKEWMPQLKALLQKDVTEQKGVLLMGSYYEAVIFSRIKAILQPIHDEDEKKYDLLDYLNVKAPERSTVIVFYNVEEMNETYTWLRSKCMRPINKVSYHLGSADDIVANWKRSVDNQEYPIMCCTDSSLHDLHIYEANSLIHYSLPPQERGYFNERFSVLLNRLAGPPEFYTPGKMPLTFSKTETLIYINPNNRRQLPVLLNFFERLRKPIPEKLRNECKKIMNEKELEKDDNALCENYKKFGRCMDDKLCKFRHYFSQKYDQPAAFIPRQGFVKMQILQVHSASHYSVRLLEHRCGTNEWSEIKSSLHPGVLNMKVNMYFSDHNKRSMHVCEKIGEVAAIETTTNLFKRVQVLELKMDEKTNELRTVKVKFIDHGKIDDVRPSVLVKLSDELASIPPASVDIFLCNLLPVDQDIEWGDIINSKVRERIQNLQESEDIIFIGEIKLVAGHDVWVDPLQCHKLDDKGKDVIVIMSSMGKDLLRKEVAVKNPDHLPKLLSMYKSANLLELPEPAIEPVTENVIENQNTNEANESIEQEPPSNVDDQPHDTNANHHLNYGSWGESEDEAATGKQLEITSVNSNNPIKSTSESGSADHAIVSPEQVPSSSVICQPNHPSSDSADYDDTSEEEWPLADVPQTPAAPDKNPPKPSSPNDDTDSEYDPYDYDTDSMEIEGLLDDNEFDCYFGPEAAKELMNKLCPEFELDNKPFQGSTKSTEIVTEPKKQLLTIREVNDSEISNVPAITTASLNTDTNVFKPNVEWYQDLEFVYMNIILNVDDYTIRFETDRIYFRATYDTRVYEFNEVLFTSIDESTSKYYKSGVMVVVKMEKLIKMNKWKHIFKTKLSMGWIKKSTEHLDEDIQVPDMYWGNKLNPGLAIKEPDIPEDLNYNNTTIKIYPDGYEDYLCDSNDDSDAVCNDNDGEQ